MTKSLPTMLLILAAMAAGFIGGVLSSQVVAAKGGAIIVKAHEFQVLAPDGTVVGRLGGSDQGGSLALTDGNEREQLRLGVSQAGPKLALADKAGNALISMRVSKGKDPRITISDKEAARQTTIGYHWLPAPKGQRKKPFETILIMREPDGKAGWWAP